MSNSSWKKVTKQILQLVDVYGSHVRLYVRGNTTYQTPLGGVLSVILLILMVVFALYFGLDMITRKNPKLINYMNYYNEPMSIKDKNLFVSFEVLYRNRSNLDLLKENNYFKFDIFNSSENYLNHQFEYEKLGIQKCSKNMIDYFRREDKEVLDYLLIHSQCIILPDLIFQGSPFIPHLKRSIKFSLNVNSSKLRQEFNQTVIDEMFPLRFRIFYQSYYFDLDNYENPLNPKIYFTEINLTLENSYNSFFSFNQANLTRDDDILLPSKNTSSIFGFNKFFFFSNNVLENDGAKKLLNSEIYLDNYQEIFIRRYDKLPDAAAQVLGISRIINIIFQIIVFLYTFDRINEQLAFKFYKYKFENQETPAELYKRRKTIMHKELSIKVPIKERNFSIIEKNFQFLYHDKNLDENKKSHISRFFETPTSNIKIIDDKNKSSKYDSSAQVNNDRSEENRLRFEPNNNDSNRSNDLISSNANNKHYIEERKNGVSIIISNLKNSNNQKNLNKDNYNKKFIDQLILNFDRIFQKQDKLTFRDKFLLMFRCCRLGDKLKEKNYFYQKAKAKIKEKLDIVFILNKLDELDKFKMMYLNPYQNLALSYCKKANILHTNYMNLIDFYEHFCEESDEKKNVFNILEYFIYKLRKKNTDILDRKLLEMIEPELLKAIYDNID
jgi:hypothetical protein